MIIKLWPLKDPTTGRFSVRPTSPAVGSSNVRLYEVFTRLERRLCTRRKNFQFDALWLVQGGSPARPADRK